MRRALLPVFGAVVLGLPGCATTHTTTSTATIPARLLAGMRPIGAGPRFQPDVSGRPTGACHVAPGMQEAHLELFGANRVILIPGGVGHAGNCYGNVVTTDPTGVVHFRAGASLADLFRAWGQPFSAGRLLSFTGTVRFYVAGKRTGTVPPLSQHEQIVIEVGPYVPPHRFFTFPKGL